MIGREQVLNLSGLLLRIFATAWVAWVLAGMVWLASGHNNATLTAPARTAGRAAPTVDVSRLATLDLFGAPPLATATGEAANAPDTSLQLRLTGVFVNANAEKSSAIVAERNNAAAAAKVYRINEGLPGGATLAEVYDDRILLKRGDGASEVLRFEKTGLLDGRAPPANESSDGAAANGTATVRDMVANALQALTEAPEAFLQKMGLKSGGRGYEVTEATPEDLRTAIGLQPGDRLVSVNGRRLGDPQRDREVLAALKDSASAKVEIQRGGQMVTLERKF